MDSDRLEADCTCKVGDLIDEYDFTDANEDLVSRWTSKRGDSMGTRALADRFNRRILRAEMRNADMELIEGRTENLYELLTDDDRLEADYMQARSSLEGGGIDVGRLESRFISHQTVYRHLQNCLGAEKGQNTLSIDKERDLIRAVQNRSEAIVDDSITRLRNGNELEIDEFEVLINFRITCETCGTLHDVNDLLDAGKCDCQH